MKDWFNDSNIQEGLMGSDHCPVYAVLKDVVTMDGDERYTLDIVNPPGMFEGGLRKQEWSTRNLLPMSGKLIKEFDKRQSIRDMFTRKPSLQRSQSTILEDGEDGTSMQLPTLSAAATVTTFIPLKKEDPAPLAKTVSNTSSSPKATTGKRAAKTTEAAPMAKRSKTVSQSAPNGTGKGQQSLKGFFAAKSTSDSPKITDAPSPKTTSRMDGPVVVSKTLPDPIVSPAKTEASTEDEAAIEAASLSTKQTWGKLFSKPVSPKCEHGEPCKTMVTKKPGVNCGRSFWMCNRPLGPSGKQEKNSQWRCSTFIWASGWDTHAGEPP